ncbi:MAG: hypothetical protein N3D75_03735 [Candidatus Aenigmarchaeota archaeon]|nr:hypothetical protein [Candidatus Aenigmarchaeota archaeon]
MSIKEIKKLIKIKKISRMRSRTIFKLSELIGCDSENLITTSFHPRASVTNSHITEVLILNLIYQYTNLEPTLFGFTFDTPYKTGERKDRSPVIIPFDNYYITLRSPNKIGGFPISLSASLTENEISRINLETKRIISENGKLLQKYLDNIQFGHVLFDLRRHGTKKLIEKSCQRSDIIKKIYLDSAKNSTNLGDSITKINLGLLHFNNFRIYGMPFDLIIKNFPEIAISSVKMYPELFQHICSDAKRYPIYLYSNTIKSECPNGCVFSTDNFLESIGNNFVPTGLMCLVFLSIFSDHTICGSFMKDYYIQNLPKAREIARNLGYDTDLKIITFERNRCVQAYGTYDIVSFLNTMSNLGRNFYLNGYITIPEDVEEHQKWIESYIKEKKITERINDFERDSELTRHFLGLFNRSISRPTLYEMSVFGIKPYYDGNIIVSQKGEYWTCNIETENKAISQGKYYSYDTSIMQPCYFPLELQI